ncbi:glycoside hydrolase [Scytonema sp. UIC 10036]|uniref:endo-1,4-beta-xylanase n=1 Tax=Scytonema sp. UIC 10036 TaxID=2304196 RepID=UPI0012DA571A|nr:endo-1,4-beta-xylanase [Scytonema sp. UIC 10036]MUG96322.1 glycoside hydrolase [Scytonema sp. UIC 10036]
MNIPNFKRQQCQLGKQTTITLLAALFGFLTTFCLHNALTLAGETNLLNRQAKGEHLIAQISSDTAWRQTAAQNIEKYRKGDLTVVVTDANGNPIPNADVRVAMKRHAYSFGSAIDDVLLLSSNNPDGERYRDNVLRLFNEAVSENGLKWDSWENLQLRPQVLEALNWLKNRNLKVRGHSLIWPSWRSSPPELETRYNNTLALQGKAAADDFLRTRTISHITEQVSYLRGQLHDWDVVNEPCDNTDFQTILGQSILVDWYKTADRADPNAVLYVNQNLYESDLKADEYESVIQYLLNNGAPLEGIGIEGHLIDNIPISIPKFISTLDRFAKFNLPIKITEFDAITGDKQLQAEVMRDVMTAVFSHPATVGFLMWGFWDSKHWLNNAPIYDPNWNLKPSGQVYLDLVFNQWWTNTLGKTDANGEYKVRGFLGDYEVTASKNFTSQTVSTTLSRDGRRLTISGIAS